IKPLNVDVSPCVVNFERLVGSSVVSYLRPLVSRRISSSSVRPSRAPTGRSIATSLPSSHLNATVTLAGFTLRSGSPLGRTVSNALQSRPARSVKRRIDVLQTGASADALFPQSHNLF